MNTITCLIVDDEPIARKIIQMYCKHLPNLEVLALCTNALEAKVILQQQKVDILFLDINMPVIDGIAFMKTVKNRTQVILTTAYKEYAVDAFDLAACDYLLKPFSLERFMIAIDRALEKLQGPVIPTAEVADINTKNYLFIKTGDKIYKIQYDDLLFAEAKGNYTKIMTTQGTLMPSMTFSYFEELLPQLLFLRVHRSFIVNKSKISHIEGNRIFIDENEIPIGLSYKEKFLKNIGFQ